MATHPTPLKFLSPVWFSCVMGLSGLSLAWHRAAPLMGEAATNLAQAAGALAGLVFVALLAASGVRQARHPQALSEDLKHAVRHVFLATLPVAGLLLATVLTVLLGEDERAHGLDLLGLRGLTDTLWWVSSLGQLAVTVWVTRRWLNPVKGQGLAWATVTPALLIPVVGNVLAPLAGVPLGHAAWSAAQFGIGVVFWPVLLTLLVVRIAVQGLWPERMLPATFILIAPPAVIGLSGLQLGMPIEIGWMCWGAALFCGLWAAGVVKRMLAQPFGMAHWGLSFPLAALTSLTLRLGGLQGPLATLGPVLLALTTLVIVWLTLGTIRGLRDGSLLAPEPVASIQVAQPTP